MNETWISLLDGQIRYILAKHSNKITKKKGSYTVNGRPCVDGHLANTDWLSGSPWAWNTSREETVANAGGCDELPNAR